MINYIEKGKWLHDAIAEAGHSLRQTNGKWVSSDDDAVQAIIDSFDPMPLAMAEKVQEFNECAQAEASAFIVSYPDFEISTWPKQREEAEAFSKDDTTPTPYMDIVAEQRGIDREELLDKTLTKIALFDENSAVIAGKRQKAYDKAKASSTLAELLSVKYGD